MARPSAASDVLKKSRMGKRKVLGLSGDLPGWPHRVSRSSSQSGFPDLEGCRLMVEKLSQALCASRVLRRWDPRLRNHTLEMPSGLRWQDMEDGHKEKILELLG